MKHTVQVAHAHVRSLREIVRLLHANGVLDEQTDVTDVVSQTVHGLFELVAWSDRSLHLNEIRLLDVLLEQDAEAGGALEQHIAAQADVAEFSRTVPAMLKGAVLLDQRHASRISQMLLHTIENIGEAILLADGRVDPAENRSMREYLAMLQDFVASRTTASIAPTA